MAKTKPTKPRSKKKAGQSAPGSLEGVYLFKLVFYLLIGSIWIKTTNGDAIGIAIPIGLVIGLAFTTHEHFQLDRKIEYAVLLVAMLFGYFAPYGLYVNF